MVRSPVPHQVSASRFNNGQWPHRSEGSSQTALVAPTMFVTACRCHPTRFAGRSYVLILERTHVALGPTTVERTSHHCLGSSAWSRRFARRCRWCVGWSWSTGGFDGPVISHRRPYSVVDHCVAWAAVPKYLTTGKSPPPIHWYLGFI
jgi:hypothetical protein